MAQITKELSLRLKLEQIWIRILGSYPFFLLNIVNELNFTYILSILIL